MGWRRFVGAVLVVVCIGCPRPHAATSHRATASACPATRARGNAGASYGDCDADVQCDAGTNGRCNALSSVSSPGGLFDSCSYDGCFVDDDCGAHRACICDANAGNHCIAADCRVDADCPNGFQCSISEVPSCGGEPVLTCHTSSDECVDTSDCNQNSVARSCASNGSKWVCQGCGADG